MKVIFLDVDGVLNAAYTRERAPSGTIGLNPQMVRQLKRIVDATGAVAVLVSSWKKDWDIDPDKCTRCGACGRRCISDETRNENADDG